MDSPDFSNTATIGSVLTFIPGVMVGFVGFLVFGTTSFFRGIYAESMRDCCCCGGGKGRRRGGRSATSLSSSDRREREAEDGRSWNALGNGRGRVQTYHCRVESAGLGEVELTGFGRVVGKGKGDGGTGASPVVKTFEAQKSPGGGGKAQQPWKTLGIDPPTGNHAY